MTMVSKPGVTQALRAVFGSNGRVVGAAYYTVGASVGLALGLWDTYVAFVYSIPILGYIAKSTLGPKENFVYGGTVGTTHVQDEETPLVSTRQAAAILDSPLPPPAAATPAVGFEAESLAVPAETPTGPALETPVTTPEAAVTAPTPAFEAAGETTSETAVTATETDGNVVPDPQAVSVAADETVVEAPVADSEAAAETPLNRAEPTAEKPLTIDTPAEIVGETPVVMPETVDKAPAFVPETAAETPMAAPAPEIIVPALGIMPALGDTAVIAPLAGEKLVDTSDSPAVKQSGFLAAEQLAAPKVPETPEASEDARAAEKLGTGKPGMVHVTAVMAEPSEVLGEKSSGDKTPYSDATPEGSVAGSEMTASSYMTTQTVDPSTGEVVPKKTKKVKKTLLQKLESKFHLNRRKDGSKSMPR